MKYAHYVAMRVFCREEDNEDEIIETIKKLFPLDFEKDAEITSRTAYGFEDNKIKIFTVSLKKIRDINKFVKHFFSNLSKEQKELLEKQMESRLDKTLHFYIRLEKDKLLDGEYWITDSGRCFHFKFAVAAYPHKREVARQVVKRMLGNS
jgi:RNA binding exosome subunit